MSYIIYRQAISLRKGDMVKLDGEWMKIHAVHTNDEDEEHFFTHVFLNKTSRIILDPHQLVEVKERKFRS